MFQRSGDSLLKSFITKGKDWDGCIFNSMAIHDLLTKAATFLVWILEIVQINK